MLTRLIARRRGTERRDRPVAGAGTARDRDRVERDWDRMRANATSDAERAEIDAVFGRYVA